MSHLVDTDLVIDGLAGASDALAHLAARVTERRHFGRIPGLRLEIL